MMASILPRSSPAAFTTESPVSESADLRSGQRPGLSILAWPPPTIRVEPLEEGDCVLSITLLLQNIYDSVPECKRHATEANKFNPALPTSSCVLLCIAHYFSWKNCSSACNYYRCATPSVSDQALEANSPDLQRALPLPREYFPASAVTSERFRAVTRPFRDSCRWQYVRPPSPP